MSRLTINSNILSLNAQRRFSGHTKKLEETFSRLSSGLRITKASTDAAGLAVSTDLNFKEKVKIQGIRNLNDGVSYLNIASGAINELGNVLIRIQELAEQGANGTLGIPQRESLQSEVTALVNEYNRIIRSTEFNGEKLLTGINTSIILQGGFGEKNQLTTQIGKAGTSTTDIEFAGDVELASFTSSGGLSNGVSFAPKASANGEIIGFTSNATNLVTGDTNGFDDVFVTDMSNNTIKRISVSSSGVQGNGNSDQVDISKDGNFAIFRSSASNLVAGDTNGLQDIFWHNISTGETRRVSVASDGTESNGTSEFAAISGNGRYVVFESNATNLVAGDTNGQWDIFLHDTLTGTTERVSMGLGGAETNGTSYNATVSDDGSFIAFVSTASNIDPAATSSNNQIFLYNRTTQETILVSKSDAGIEGNGQSNNPSISADGRFIAYSSTSNNLVAGDTNGFEDVFVFDTLTQTTRRVSVSSDGTQANNQSEDAQISSDGRFISFISRATNLVEGDTNGTTDLFVKDLESGETRRIGFNSDGSQTNNNISGRITSDGRSALYQSTENLNGSVTNGLSDIFRADISRIGLQELSGMVVSNQVSSLITLDLAKRYQNELSLYQGAIGASLSRADTFLSNLQTQSLSLQTAVSQIVDADFAQESSNLIKTQILQQAASSVLALANIQPQIVLSLLSDDSD